MSYRNGNYCAFYVDEPFSDSTLGAHATQDFCYYNTLKMWKGQDATFPFNNSHDKTYSVRDGSDWETTLKPRLRERIRNSKNIVLFLSSKTRNSRALREEIDYGVSSQGLPIIVIYPEYKTKSSLLNFGNTGINDAVRKLWDNLPALREAAKTVPVLHIPMDKATIVDSLNDNGFSVSGKIGAENYFYKV